MEIAEGLKRDIENINNKINNIKTVKTKLDFLYGHIYHVEDLKLQFTKKIEMKKRIIKHQKYIINNPNSKNQELTNKIQLRFRFDVLSLNSVERGFYILSQIKIIINDFLVILKLKSRNIIDKIHHPERINFDAEIIILFIKALTKYKIAKNQYSKNISPSKMVKILMKVFILRTSTGKEYTEQTLIKKLSDDYKLKKNVNGLKEFTEKIQEIKNDFLKTPYIRALKKTLRKKIQI
ncbi:MAG: hypothetical protein U0W65_00130 [Bacteroidia bacterium]